MNWKSLMKRLTFYNLKKGMLYLRHYGIKDFSVRLRERFADGSVDYNKWFKNRQMTGQERQEQKGKLWNNPPVFSVVVPVYHTPELFLRPMIECVINQTYPYLELCIADGSSTGEVEKIIGEYQAKDGRIKYRRLKENQGISGNTNQAMKMAEGDYVCLLDHDDLLEEDALFQVASLLEREPEAEVIYTDEDKIDEAGKEYFQPHFKPDFNLDLLRSNNYICHLLVVKRTLREKVGEIDSNYDGAQDYDFIFRCIEQAEKICHVPRVLYHWRVHKASTADNPMSKGYTVDAGKRAIEAHLERMGEQAEVIPGKDLGFYRVKYQLRGTPLVSILIPNKDQHEMLQECIASIANKSTYKNYEIIIIENNSTKPETFAFYDSLKDRENVKIVVWRGSFNYAAINNYGARYAKGEYLLLLNNDITVITPDWIQELAANCQRSQVGAVGARLYFPDDTIQHAGIVAGIGGSAGALFVGMKRNYTGYMHRAVLQQNLSAVTAACMMVKTEVFEQVGCFDEKLAVAFNDVELCLSIRAAGYLIVYNPQVEMYHGESKTRGYEDTEEKKARFEWERDYLIEKWPSYWQQGDPCYNPNLSLKTCDYSIAP